MGEKKATVWECDNCGREILADLFHDAFPRDGYSGTVLARFEFIPWFACKQGCIVKAIKAVMQDESR